MKKFSWTLRSCGAFFIRRSQGALQTERNNRHHDDAYKFVLKVFLFELLRHGHSLEFFIEGTRYFLLIPYYNKC